MFENREHVASSLAEDEYGMALDDLPFFSAATAAKESAAAAAAAAAVMAVANMEQKSAVRYALWAVLHPIYLPED
jgi:hypothetical protein